MSLRFLQVARKSRLLFTVGLLLMGLRPHVANADAFVSYRVVGTFELPAGTGPFDILNDGRLVALVSDQVHVETSPRSRSFSLHGILPNANLPSYGAAFLRTSPDGTRIAVGNNGGDESLPADYEVGVFTVDTLSGTWFDADHFDAEWIDNVHLALTAGDFVDASVVTALDTTSPDPANPVNPIIITNIGGASGGIVIDEGGNLYTGNGYSFLGPSTTGATMAFDGAALETVLSGGPAPDFEVDGILVVDILSASPLGFDREGNLFVGGGDAYGSGEGDFVALVRSSAVAASLTGAGPADTDNPTQVRRLDPDEANDANYYSANYNPVTHELLLTDYGDTTVHVYVDISAVPTMTTWAATVMALLLTTAATVAFRRHAATPATTGCSTWGAA